MPTNRHRILCNIEGNPQICGHTTGCKRVKLNLDCIASAETLVIHKPPLQTVNTRCN